MKTRSHLTPGALRERLHASLDDARTAFARTGDGKGSAQLRAAEVEAALAALWTTIQAPLETTTRGMVQARPEPPPIAVFATGGFGRRELFPYSDVDLLFLCPNEGVERDAHEPIRRFTQSMWDAGLRASPATRTLKECERLDGEANLEFAISLLDRRFLLGDAALGSRFDRELMPRVLEREAAGLAKHLVETARNRYHKYGDTIFHLEPNLKECPGGLRDVHLAHWLSLLRLSREGSSAAEPSGTSALGSREDLQAAAEFMAAARCFLHFRNGRDENTLDWAAQDEAAAESIGLETLGSADPAYWMRTYYRHARAISRRACLQMDEWEAGARKPLLRNLRRRRSPIAGTPFAVEDGRITLENNASGNLLLIDADALLRVFGSVAQYGSRLTEDTEQRIAEALPALAVHLPEGPFLWNCLRDVLLGPHAAHALRLMHAIGLLELILPEFHGIDSLVVRDAYHRYTVDEHTFLVIESVHALRTPRHEWERRFSTLWPEIERQDLFLLALLLHDTGKARRTGDHARESIELAERVFARLEFDLEERETVRRLIRNHLQMSLALRRDIFDPDNVRLFSRHAAGPQQLKMLTLLTFADVKSVNPDALTPWKAENIWQLYIATANYLDRSVDETRYHVDADPVVLSRVLSRVAAHSDPRGTEDELAQAGALRRFLEGMPQRYLQTRLPDQVSEHFQLSLQLDREPVQLALQRHRQFNEVTLITRDRPLLFADMAGALSAWGMNIVKADAFSNDAGLILDSFQFTDPFRTLELNPGEHGNFVASLRSALGSSGKVEEMLRARQRPRHGGLPAAGARHENEPRFHFDSESSRHCTLLQVVTADSPGLLRTLAIAIARCGCNIEVALIDTEGEIAIDVFYLTVGGGRLREKEQLCLAERIREVLPARLPGEPGQPGATGEAECGGSSGPPRAMGGGSGRGSWS